MEEEVAVFKEALNMEEEAATQEAAVEEALLDITTQEVIMQRLGTAAREVIAGIREQPKHQ